MNRLLVLAALGLTAACSTPAQPPPPTPPPAAIGTVKSEPLATTPAAPTGPVTDGDVTAGDVAGIQVLVQRWPGADLVATVFALRGGVLDADARTAGAELLGLRTAASGGTETLDKDAYSRRLTKLGSSIDGDSAPNFSTLSAKALRSAWEPTFDLLVDVYLHPGLPASELDLQRQRQLQQLKREQENPDAALQVLGHKMLFAGTPYANRPVGTEESVKALTAEDVRARLARLRARNRLLVVVVGDVDPGAVLARVEKALAGLPAGGPLPPAPGPIAFTAPRLQVLERKLPTNFIRASFAGPAWQSPDFAAGRLAAGILAEREFIEVRTKRNLSYAAGAGLAVSWPQSFGGLYTSAVDPGAALPVMQSVVKNLGEKGVAEKDLAGYRSTFLTQYFMGAETTDGRALRLVAGQLLGGDWRVSRTLPERIRQVTSKDIQAFVQKYVKDYQVAVVGDPKKVDLAMLH